MNLPARLIDTENAAWIRLNIPTHSHMDYVNESKLLNKHNQGGVGGKNDDYTLFFFTLFSKINI